MTSQANAALLLGAHLSISGGRHKVFERAASLGCNVVQFFTHNPRQWLAPPIPEPDIDLFRTRMSITGIIAAAHTSYLVNLVSANDEVKEKSFALFTTELRFAGSLGLPFLILHPGNTGLAADSGTLSLPIKTLASSIDRAIEESGNASSAVLLETSTGGASVIGTRFEHLRDIISYSRYGSRFGVCFDTCHVFASGFDMRTDEEYEKTLNSFDTICGLDAIRFFHVNDSKNDAGSKKDRHEHIGKGKLGIKAFSLLLNDRRFDNTPKCIETPKGKNYEWDPINLDLLRSLIGS
jgi:deoxyribonuclease-4